MLQKNLSFFLTVVMLFACGFTAVIMAAQDKTSSPARTWTGKPIVSVRKKPTQGTRVVSGSRRYKSISELERAREARAELKKMRDQKLEKFEARQADRKARQLAIRAEEEEIKALGEDKKVVLLQRKVTRLESTVKELEKRLDLLETIISDEDPALIYEGMEQLQYEEKTSVEK